MGCRMRTSICAWKKMLKRPELFPNGYHLAHYPLSEEIKTLVKNEDWSALDQALRRITQKDGSLFSLLQNYHDFSDIEFIISVRDASNPWEEDGIWHDDGSRVFAFSLSLTTNAEEIEGGRLGIRLKGQERSFEIPTPELGTIILFLTGKDGLEHKIHQVKKGKRIVMAGWCS